jgi:hypothetical protein
MNKKSIAHIAGVVPLNEMDIMEMVASVGSVIIANALFIGAIP